jgi:hypothetical protein
MSTSVRRTLPCVIALAVLVCIMAAGCGGDENPAATTSTSGSTTGGATVDWSRYCDDRAALQCPQFDAVACKEQETCARSLVRDEVEGPIVECLLDMCGWESCLTKTSDVPLSNAGEAFFKACVERVTACGLGNDSCYAGNLVADAGISELSACLGLATCSETDACMTNYFATKFETCSQWY